MLKEQIVKSPESTYRDFIVESAKELVEDDKYLPLDKDLPTDWERFVELRTENRKGQELTIKRVGVRKKAATATVTPASSDPAVTAVLPIGVTITATSGSSATEPDTLNSLDLPALELEAAKSGVTITDKWRKKSKAEKVKDIREQRAKVAP